MGICGRCGKEGEIISNTVICNKCQIEILKKNFGKRYHPTEIAEKIDNLERKISLLESKLGTY